MSERILSHSKFLPQEVTVTRSTLWSYHHDGLEQRQSVGYWCGGQSNIRDVVERFCSSTVRYERHAAELEILRNETGETGRLRRKHSEWFHRIEHSLSFETSRSVQSLERSIWVCGILEMLRTVLLQHQMTARNCSRWLSKINTETLSIIDGKEKAKRSASSYANQTLFLVARFGDGYIMIGFSGGYFICISTYHKEIGEVNSHHSWIISRVSWTFVRSSRRNCTKHAITKVICPALLFRRCCTKQRRAAMVA